MRKLAENDADLENLSKVFNRIQNELTGRKPATKPVPIPQKKAPQVKTQEPKSEFDDETDKEEIEQKEPKEEVESDPDRKDIAFLKEYLQKRGIQVNLSELEEATHGIQAPMKSGYENWGNYTLTPFKRPVDGPDAKPRTHLGVDLVAPEGTPLYPLAPGVVYRTGTNEGTGGNMVFIASYVGGRLIESIYMHCSSVLAQKGTVVGYDTEVAKVGKTGNAVSPHAHVETFVNDARVDPASLFFVPTYGKLEKKESSFINQIKKAGEINNINRLIKKFKLLA